MIEWILEWKDETIKKLMIHRFAEWMNWYIHHLINHSIKKCNKWINVWLCKLINKKYN